MNQKQDILVVGELNVDIILNKINKMPVPGQEQRADEMTLTMGSSTAIFAANASKLGSSVGFTGKVGNDTYGSYMVEALRKYQVNTEAIIVDPELKTGATVIFVLEEDRMMVTHPGAMEHFSAVDISDDLLKRYRHIHTSTLFFQPLLKDSLAGLFKRAKRLGLTTSMDSQWDPEEKWDLDLTNILPYTDFFLPNESELLAMAGTEDLDKALHFFSKFNSCLVVKRGTRGALLLQRPGEKLTVEGLRVPEVVDTVGAGDSFNAGFINAFLKNKDLQTCLEEGNRTAAVSVTKPGGVAAISSYEQVREESATFYNQ
ncbi:MAG TPA: carbohydrate kinase family protein [Balneolaceae bacterium]|nr:carbohydrate kinase family protein [Balneolaceae bacterium]